MVIRNMRVIYQLKGKKRNVGRWFKELKDFVLYATGLNGSYIAKDDDDDDESLIHQISKNITDPF